MFSSSCLVTGFNWLLNVKADKFEALSKLRYRQSDQEVSVEVINETTVKLIFKTKQKAVSIGQFAVLYSKEGICYGGGVISSIS